MRKHLVKVALVGYGYWGQNVLKAFNESDLAEVVVCCDLDVKRLQVAQKKYPAVHVTTNIDDILQDNKIDAVIIATHAATHFDLGSKVLNAKKHLWIEKPMTTNSRQSEKLLSIANRNKKIIFVDHIFLYTRAVTFLKRFIENGSLGDVHYFDSIRINLGIFQPDNNVIWDLAPHDISIICHLLGKTPRAVSAHATSHIKSNLEDVAYINLMFDKNISAHIAVSWLSPVKIRRTLIAGSKKMITYDDLETSEKIKIYDYGVIADKSYRPESSTTGHQYRTGDIFSPALESKDALLVAANHFIKSIRLNKQPLTNGKTGHEVVRILEAASLSLKQNGRVQKISI